MFRTKIWAKFDPRSRMYLVKQKSAGAVEYGIPICGQNPTPSIASVDHLDFHKITESSLDVL